MSPPKNSEHFSSSFFICFRKIFDGAPLSIIEFNGFRLPFKSFDFGSESKHMSDVTTFESVLVDTKI